jgi:hypothetical protein
MMLIQSRVWRKKDLMAHIRNEINNIQAPRNGERRRRLLPCNWLTDRELYSARDRIYWFLIKIDLHLSPPPYLSLYSHVIKSKCWPCRCGQLEAIGREPGLL